jgi:hypothetical protein
MSFEKALQRPRNFFKLSAQEQWDIDKSLGILDWQGVENPTEEQKRRWREHFHGKEEE